MTKLEAIYSRVKDTKVFQDAVACISCDFHNYDNEEDAVYEDGTLEDFCYEASTEDREFTWGSGVSKVALVCNDSNGDEYALKTSYVGCAYCRDWCNDEDEDSEQEIDEKDIWAFDTYDKVDECRVEYLVYRAAVAAGLGHFFAEMIKIDTGVYMQEKYDTSISRLDDASLYVSETLIDRCRDEYYDHSLYFEYDSVEELAEEYGLSSFLDHLKSNSTTFLMFLSRYGVTELHRLQAFLDEYDINDLHASNIGMFGDDIKFIDYCGYCSSTSSAVGADHE